MIATLGPKVYKYGLCVFKRPKPSIDTNVPDVITSSIYIHIYIYMYISSGIVCVREDDRGNFKAVFREGLFDPNPDLAGAGLRQPMMQSASAPQKVMVMLLLLMPRSTAIFRMIFSMTVLGVL